MSKLESMQRFVPSVFRPTSNTNIKGLLEAWSASDDDVVSAIQDAKEQIYVATASLSYLDALGMNVDVERPSYFNMTDDLFRQLIPALSYLPKQVLPTIERVLAIFFGANNPKVQVNEISPNEILIQIPKTFVAFRRTLRGAFHIHSYGGTITSVDNTNKTISTTMYKKSLAEDELVSGRFGQANESRRIVSHTTGATPVFSFASSDDLSSFVSGKFIASHPTYLGSYIPSANAEFTVTRIRGILGANIDAGSSLTSLPMIDSSSFPDSAGRLIIGRAGSNEESGVKYTGRPNNTALSVDPSYVFTQSHSAGDVVNVIVYPYRQPRTNGYDYSAYLGDAYKARLLAQTICETLVAAGVVITWTVV